MNIDLNNLSNLSEFELREIIVKAETVLKRKGSDLDVIKGEIQSFANKHKYLFDYEGEIGFGTSCVGIMRDGSYLDINPIDMNSPNYDYFEEFYNERLCPPRSVTGAYKKHSCLCVIVEDGNTDEAIRQLSSWINNLESIGVEVVDRPNNFRLSIEALLKGLSTATLKVKV